MKNKLSLFLIMLIVILPGLLKAQVADVVNLNGYYAPDTVSLFGTGPINIDDYIKGVLYAEIRGLSSNTNPQAGFDAFAITARSTLYSYLSTHPNAYALAVPNATCLQGCDLRYSTHPMPIIDTGRVN